MKLFTCILFLLFHFIAKGQVEGGDIPAIDFEFPIQRILSTVDFTKYKVIEINCMFENKNDKSQSNTRFFYYFSSNSTLECLQIENDGKNYSRLLRNSFKIIGTLFYPIPTNGSCYDCVDSINVTKINGLMAYLVYRKGWDHRSLLDTLIMNKNYILGINRKNNIGRDSSIYYLNGERFSSRISETHAIKCFGDSGNYSIITQIRTTEVVKIDTNKISDNIFWITETKNHTQQEIMCEEGDKSSWIDKSTWQCTLNKERLIEKIELVSMDGYRMMHMDKDQQLIMTINYSNVRQNEFCKYVNTLKNE